MAGTAYSDFLTALRTSLQTAVNADATFGTAGAGVKVYLTAEGGTALDERIILIAPGAGISVTQEYNAIGAKRRDERVTFPGVLFVKSAGSASQTSATAEAALDRAQALADLLIVQLRDSRPSVGDTTFAPIVRVAEYTPQPVDQGWIVECQFDIEVTIRVS